MRQNEVCQLSNKKQIDLLYNEISETRMNLKNMITHQMQIIYLFVTSFTATVGSSLLLYKDLFGNDITMKLIEIISILFSQTTFFLGVLLITVSANIAICRGYIRGVEKKINNLANENISFFEHDVSRYFYFTLKGVYFWSFLILILFCILIFMLLILYQFHKENYLWFSILTIEVVICLTLVFFLRKEANRVKKYTLNIYNVG